MTCEKCGGQMKEREATTERPYFYVVGGLPEFPLTAGATVGTCTRCRTESITLQAPGQLHRRIARVLLAKPAPLTGDELRFLRKHAGFSAQRFAEMLDVDPAHLSRVEHGKRASLGRTTERLARTLLAMAEDGEVPSEGILLPTGTEGADALQAWKDLAARTPTTPVDRRALPVLWGSSRSPGLAQQKKATGVRKPTARRILEALASPRNVPRRTRRADAQ